MRVFFLSIHFAFFPPLTYFPVGISITKLERSGIKSSTGLLPDCIRKFFKISHRFTVNFYYFLQILVIWIRKFTFTFLGSWEVYVFFKSWIDINFYQMLYSIYWTDHMTSLHYCVNLVKIALANFWMLNQLNFRYKSNLVMI